MSTVGVTQKEKISVYAIAPLCRRLLRFCKATVPGHFKKKENIPKIMLCNGHPQNFLRRMSASVSEAAESLWLAMNS